MAGERIPARVGQSSFDGGLNLQRDDYSDGLESSLRAAENARLTVFGRVQRRRGTTRMHTAALPAAVQGLLTLTRPGESLRLLAVSGGNLYVHTGDPVAPLNWVVATKTGGLVINSAATAPVVSMVAFRDGGAMDVVYLADGSGLLKYNPSASPQLTRVTGSPVAVSYVWSYNNRLLGVTGLSEKLYASELGNGDSLGQPAGVTANVRTYGDGVLTAGVTQGGRAVLFHETGISAFTGVGLGDIAISSGTQGVTAVDGTRAPRSVTLAEQDVYFWSTDRGPCKLSANGAVETVGLQIRPLYERLSKQITSGVVAINAPREYEVWWFVPTIGVLIYNYALNAWSGPWNGGYLTDAPTVFLPAATDTDTSQFMLYGTQSGWVLTADTENVFVDNAAYTVDAPVGEGYETIITTAIKLWAGGLEHAAPLRVALVMARRGSFLGTLTVAGWRDQELLQLFSGTQYVAQAVLANGSPIRWDVPGTTWDSGGAFDQSDVDVVYRRLGVGLSGPWVQVTFRDMGPGDSYITRITVEGVLLGRKGDL